MTEIISNVILSQPKRKEITSEFQSLTNLSGLNKYNNKFRGVVIQEISNMKCSKNTILEALKATQLK